MKKGLVFLALLLLALAACGGQAKADSKPASYEGQLLGAVFDPPRKMDDFTLSATQGETFTLSEQRGKLVLLYFGYMTCPDVCPTTSATLSQVYKHLGELAEQVEVVFVTVDPERDTLERLTLYMNAFNENFVALRGDDIQPVLDGFGATATKRVVGDSPLSYLMDHTASVFLIGQDGKLIEQFIYGTRYQDILHDVRLILGEENS